MCVRFDICSAGYWHSCLIRDYGRIVVSSRNRFECITFCTTWSHQYTWRCADCIRKAHGHDAPLSSQVVNPQHMFHRGAFLFDVDLLPYVEALSHRSLVLSAPIQTEFRIRSNLIPFANSTFVSKGGKNIYYSFPFSIIDEPVSMTVPAAVNWRRWQRNRKFLSQTKSKLQ